MNAGYLQNNAHQKQLITFPLSLHYDLNGEVMLGET